MPHPDRRPQYVVGDDLGPVHIWRLVDQRIGLRIQCDACDHATEWPPRLLQDRLRKRLGQTVFMVAAKLRCTRCRSNFIHIGRAGPSTFPLSPPSHWG
jgi:hypothetical protein